MKIRVYRDKELRKIWTGYVEVPGWTIFIPANGGKPFLWKNE